MFYQKEKVHIMYIADSPVITKKDKVHLPTTANSTPFVHQNKSKTSNRPHKDCEGTFTRHHHMKVSQKQQIATHVPCYKIWRQ